MNIPALKRAYTRYPVTHTQTVIAYKNNLADLLFIYSEFNDVETFIHIILYMNVNCYMLCNRSGNKSNVMCSVNPCREELSGVALTQSTFSKPHLSFTLAVYIA